MRKGSMIVFMAPSYTDGMPLPADLLRRNAEEAVRLIVLDLLSQAREAAPRCLDPEDAEGLHDFRVSIRRLRSTLSAWKGLLRGVVKKRDRRTLTGFQKRTGSSRDAEVTLEWLEEQVDELEPEHRPGYELVEARLRSALRAQSGDENRAVCNEFTEWAGGFESRVADSVPAAGVCAPYGEALAKRLDWIAGRLDACIAGLGDDRKRGPHRVRITGKRLRYLVEPVRAESEVAASLVDRCKRLQDVLGTLNDANVLGDLLRVWRDEVQESTDGESTAEKPGVLELCRLNGLRAEASYRLFRVDWLEGGGMRTLLDEAAALARQLRG
ncbi:MAG: CHAD domain-containing protein [Holophagales bacterium]|nr:CHAD domain-containing protein [Holophagales bacterium]MYI32464.1 CHAD domain-containing protein [Holophagales bacterium]